MTSNLRISSVPEPDTGPAWKAEMIKCPALVAFEVINIPLLIVPA